LPAIVVGPEIQALADALKSVSPEIAIRKEKAGAVYDAWESFLPAAVTVHIGKFFLDAFLKEIASEFAKSVRTALVKVFRKAKSTDSKYMNDQELKDYAKKVEAANKLGRDANLIERPGKSVAPLRTSSSLYSSLAKCSPFISSNENRKKSGAITASRARVRTQTH